MAIFQYVRPHKLPIFDDAIMERTRRAQCASERERTELELARSRRFPGSASTVTIDPRADTAVGAEGEGVHRRIVGRQQLVAAALKPD